MNPDAAIALEGIGKRFRLGQRAQYKTLREAIVETMTRSREAHRDDPDRVIWALRDVSLEIQRGEAVAFIGRNGAGKSTLLKLIARITQPTLGRATIRGRVGSLLEVGTGFHPELTGAENVYLNGAILGMRRTEIKRKFDDIVTFAGVERFINTPVKRYSTGMYIRLAFAVAAHLEPDVLLVDEVLAVGDAEFQKRCLGRMHEVAGQGRTVLFVSHNLPAVQRLCDRAFLLDGGRLVDSGPVDAVLDRYYRLVTEPEDAIERRVVPEGRVGYVGWSVVGSEETDFAHAYRSGDDVEFEFELVARRSLDLAQFSLSIHDAVGNFIVGTRRGVEIEDCIPLAPGTYRIRFAFPHLELKPGYYTLTAIAGNMREGLVEEWAAHPRLQVLPRSDAPADAWGGMIDARGTVEIVPDAVPQRV